MHIMGEMELAHTIECINAARRAGTGRRGPRNTRSAPLGLGDHQNTALEVYTARSTQILTTFR